ncbi:unnamed protein product [Clonostachys rosea f. rosea IK726]|nr:unnamed protein product [Clonostachys rosea f. rosea IK726]CAG9949548.1 unnamed protein product [Clonostachys rosea f. rosea IK726]
MSTPADTNKNTVESGAESPTTARPLEMDDDDVQETGILGGEGNSTTSPSGQTSNTTAVPASTTENTTQSTTATRDEVPPSKPPRPLTEAQKNEAILKEAFPSVDPGIIKAVLRASGGQVEPAFNALLEMTDPEAANQNEPQEVPPPQPPRPQGRRELTQLEADELYARQLAEHYDNVGEYEQRTSNRGDPRGQGQYPNEDREHSFIDDDLPVIRDQLRQGFAETQTKVNGWIDMLRKRIEDSFDESEDPHHQQQGQGGHGYNQGYGRPGETSRRSGDYDADPQVLGDDFAGMKLSADGTPINRTAPYTGIQRQHSTSPRPKEGRRVGFKEETEEIQLYDASPQVPPKDDTPKAGAKASKWQPLSSVDPSPIGDNDPFSLGDSEDERDHPKDTKESKPKTKDAGQDDAERLKQAAAEAMADSLVEPSPSKDGDSSAKKA